MLNGEPYEFHGSTIRDLLLALEIHGRRLAVEVNQEIVPKSEHDTFALSENDVLEIVHAIGGG